MTDRHLLASDNASGVHPEVMAKLVAVNQGHALGYGDDEVSHQAQACFRQQFGEQSETWLVFNGTGANVLALKGMVQSHETVFCCREAHLRIDECGAPEHFIGCKLVAVEDREGKLCLDSLERHLVTDRNVVHRSQPRVISLTQATERGTLYSLDELRQICDFAHRHQLLVHMDGARLANAAAALNVSFAELTTAVGIDTLSFGGTKNGLMMAEALVVLNPALQPAFPYIRKQGMQLASKQRFLAAQFLAYFEGRLWHRNAHNANMMAAYLAERLSRFEAITLSVPVAVNLVFVRLPTAWVEPLQRLTPCLVSPGEGQSEVRLVTSFDTTAADIGHFINEVGRIADREVL